MYMKKNDNNMNLSGLPGNELKGNFSGYLLHPNRENFISKFQKEKHINPGDIPGIKESNENNAVGTSHKKDFQYEVSGGHLYLPGFELDYSQDSFESEDEENNYYSLWR